MMKENKPPERGHYFYMKSCIDLALTAKARGDSPVGSVVVQDGIIIGEGIEGGKTKKDITFHAEIEAIREANLMTGNADLSDCILYTTHEPCIMCSYVIRHAEIQMVVFGGKAAPCRQRHHGKRYKDFTCLVSELFGYTQRP